MEKSEQINELALALAKAQAEIADPKKSSENPFFNSKYADLATVLAAIRGPFSKNGLSISQAPGESKDGMISVTTLIMHSSGQWLASTMSIPIGGKKDAQAAGSSITYARRYMLAAMAGIAQEDDDANLASGNDDKPKGKKPEQPSNPNPASGFKCASCGKPIKKETFEAFVKKGLKPMCEACYHASKQ